MAAWQHIDESLVVMTRRVRLRGINGVRLAALLLQASALVGLAASILGYSALSPQAGSAEVDLVLSFGVSAVLFLLFSVALVVRFPFDLLFRIPLLVVAAICTIRAAPVVLSYPKLFSTAAPLHLILAYLTLPVALGVVTSLLALDVIADTRHARGQSHAA